MMKMASLKLLQEIAAFLDGHWNRDQVYRTIQFSSTLCSGILEDSRLLPTASARFAALAGALSSARTTLRLLDDIPNLAYTFNSFCSSSKDSPVIIRLIELVSSLTGLLFYPTEHLAWAADLKIISFPNPSFSSRLWNLCVVFWLVSLLSTCLRSLNTLWRTRQELMTKIQTERQQPPAKNIAQRNPNSSDRRKRVTFQESQASVSTSNTSCQEILIRNRHTHAALSLARALSDLVIAVHYLPKGVLWAGKLPTVLVGLFGTISSLLGLYSKISPQN